MNLLYTLIEGGNIMDLRYQSTETISYPVERENVKNNPIETNAHNSREFCY